MIRKGADKKLQLSEPQVANKDWEHICFTDDKTLKSKTWQIRYVTNGKLSARKESRRYNILNDHYLPEYGLSIYMDCRFYINCNLSKLVKTYLTKGYNIAMMHSPKRQCIYEEIKHCLKHTQCPPHQLKKQRRKYLEEKVPSGIGLYRCGLLVRRHNIKQLTNFMESWFTELKNESERDTISFRYTLWKNPIKISVMPTKKVYRMFCK